MMHKCIALFIITINIKLSDQSSQIWIINPDLIQIDQFVLILKTKQELFPKGITEWIMEDGNTKNIIKKCEYRSGFVKGFIGSKCAVTICENGVTGYFTIQSEIYFIENVNGKYFIGKYLQRYKRSDRWEYFNLTGDTIDIETEVKDDLEFVTKRYNEVNWDRIDSQEVGYFVDSAWQLHYSKKKNGRVFLNPKRWLEIAIAIDHSVIAFHGKTSVEQYVLTLMNIVNAIYQDPSLEANIQLVISRLLIYNNKRETVVVPGNAKKSLENANIWNKGLHQSFSPGENHHDIAIWLTRLDIGGPSGYAPVGGTCDSERSCALNRDEGLSSAFIIAHEMAHILGLTHDGDKKAGNDCDDEALQGSVMAPMVSATFHSFLWSSCSRREFKQKASKWSCLLNIPKDSEIIKLNATLQTTFSMDEQCRMEFGNGFSLCRAFDIVDPCSHLWCGHNNTPLVCKTKKGPPLEGTECGINKWCVNGYCENINKERFNMNPVQYNPQDGGWSDWGPWGSCSRTCGTGIEFRVRKCDNPKPVYGGSDCFGSKEEWKICNVKACPEPLRDIRAQQCKRLTRLVQLQPPKDGMDWLPYESDQYELKCKLICISKKTKELHVTGENLIDGTPCSYENRNNICIQGVCQNLGCDQKLFSSKQEDSCGVCGGDNTECIQKRKMIKRRLKKDTNRLVIFPRTAKEINIEANFSVGNSNVDPTVAFILKDRKRNSYSITIPNTSSGNQIIEGTKFYYRRMDMAHFLWAKGPLLSEIIFLVYASNTNIENGLDVSFQYQYYLHKNMSETNKKYSWIIGGWGPCTKSCGGGKRTKTKACFDDHSKKIVPRKFCALLSKPNLETEVCNMFSCDFRWITGNWEPCTTTCGSGGYQYREIYCIPQSITNKTDEIWKYMINPNKCGDVKPVTIRSCYRKPCPSNWEYGKWSQCSSSCGSGISVRTPYCKPLENESQYTCNDFAPTQRKICTGDFNKHTNPFCRKKKPCFGDQSKFCILPHLEKYCKIGGFRKMCCTMCSKFKTRNIIEIQNNLL